MSMSMFGGCTSTGRHDQDQQVEFFRHVRNMSGADAANHFEELIGEERQGEVISDGGDYLPLSVWSNRGFDTAAIESHSAPEDMRAHPVLGLCYRVRIMSKAMTASRTVTRRSSIKVAAPANQALQPKPIEPLTLPTGPLALPAPEPKPVPKGPLALTYDDPEVWADTNAHPAGDGDDDDSSDSSDSSTSSSSSPSTNRKGKKHKRSKKDKKNNKKSKKHSKADNKSKKDKAYGIPKREPEDTCRVTYPNWLVYAVATSSLYFNVCI